MSRAVGAGYPEIVTPEAVILDVERAGVASRALALTLDFLALGLVYLLVLMATAYLAGGLGDLVIAVLYIVFSLVLYFAWFTVFETRWQRTLGKAALGLRVVSTDATPIRFTQAFLRTVLGLVDFFVLPLGGVAVIALLLSPRDQRLGDMVAGTLVVRERSAGGFAASARFVAPPGYEGYAASLDVASLQEEHYGLVRTFLLRTQHLNQLARVQLAVRLANPIARIMHHTPPPYLHPEAFLACVAAAWQHAHGAPLTLFGGGPAYGQPQPVYPTAPAYPGAPGYPGTGPGYPGYPGDSGQHRPPVDHRPPPPPPPPGPWQ